MTFDIPHYIYYCNHRGDVSATTREKGATMNESADGAPKPMALAGLRVLDIATMAAAPWAATYLAELGADVVKVEAPVVGDHQRRWGTPKNGEGLFWKS